MLQRAEIHRKRSRSQQVRHRRGFVIHLRVDSEELRASTLCDHLFERHLHVDPRGYRKLARCSDDLAHGHASKVIAQGLLQRRSSSERSKEVSDHRLTSLEPVAAINKSLR